MTHPTKAIIGTLLKDFVKVGGGNDPHSGLYTDKHLEMAMEKSEVIDFHQTIDISGIKVWPPNTVLTLLCAQCHT